MTEQMITDFDAITGQSVTRPATEEEIAQLAQSKATAEIKELENAEKAVAKAALLERLGITADEATLLLS